MKQAAQPMPLREGLPQSATSSSWAARTAPMRFKQFRRTLRFFKVGYGLEAPYHVLVDDTFVHDALATQPDALRLIAKVLGGRADLHVLECSARRLAQTPAQLLVVPCPCATHADAAQCLVAYAQAHVPLVLAAQSAEMRRPVREQVAGVCFVYVAGKVVMMLETPSPLSVRSARAGEESLPAPVLEAKRELEREEQQRRSQVSRVVGSGITHRLRTKGGRAKGPNPLSMKRGRKRDVSSAGPDTGTGRTRTRTRAQKRQSQLRRLASAAVTDAGDNDEAAMDLVVT